MLPAKLLDPRMLIEIEVTALRHRSAKHGAAQPLAQSDALQQAMLGR